MRALLAAFLTVGLRLVIADATNLSQTCDRIPGIPSCAEPCVRPYETAPDCWSAELQLCGSDHGDVAGCFEDHCDLGMYLGAMNATNTFCGIPPRNRKSTQIAVGSSFIVVTTLVITLRLMGRPPWSKTFGTDDMLSLCGYASSMVVTVMMLLGPQNGWGIDMWALGSNDMVYSMKLFYIGIVFFYFAAAVTKLAVLFFYLRIFTDRIFRYTTYAMIALCTAFGIAACFQTAFHCIPASFFWTRFDPVHYQGTCQPDSSFRVMPPINVVLDGLVMILPLPSIAKLKLPLHKKLRALSMFCVGILVITASILRLGYLSDTIKTYNITYNGAEISWFGVIECDVSVICTCMPPIALLLKRCSTRWQQKSSSSGSPSDGYERSSYVLHGYGSRSPLRNGTVDSTKSVALHDDGDETDFAEPNSADDLKQPSRCLGPD